MSGFVYFVQGEKGGPVKIGWTYDVRERCSTLQTGNADRLIVRHVIPGNRDLERNMHRRFAHLRLRGEWFIPNDDMVSLANVTGVIPDHMEVYVQQLRDRIEELEDPDLLGAQIATLLTQGLTTDAVEMALGSI